MGAVKYLLDTHALLWAIGKGSKLSEAAMKVIRDEDAPKFVSSVTAYEIMNKYRLGKLVEYGIIAENYFIFLSDLGIAELPITAHQAHFAGDFEWEHRDPFDRLLAAQTVLGKFTLITNDPAFDQLPWVKTLW